jgi:hypothetical protein
MKPKEIKQPPRAALRRFLEIALAFALLELGFFLFRLGAAWWNQ